MNREIEFRGKRKDNGEWIYGGFYMPFKNVCYIMVCGCRSGMQAKEVIPESVGQYTGLKDGTKWEDLTEAEREQWTRNGKMPSGWDGKKIFENDVLQSVDGRTYYVKWTNGGFWWFHKPYTKMDKYAVSLDDEAGEVLEIGSEIRKFGYGKTLKIINNIADNPELLKDKPVVQNKRRME